MEVIFLSLTILGIIIAIIFGYLQVVVPFIKREVSFSKRFPYVETAEAPAAKRRRRKRKKRKRFLIPGLAIGILIILFVLIRFLVFQAKAIERVPIAVINFTNHTGDEQFDYLCAAIPNLLITNLEQSKHLSVLTWERMRDLLKILGKEDVAVVDEDLGFEICEMDDIQTVIIGSFTKAGNMFVTEVKVLDVTSKKILKTSSSQGEGVASILKIQIDELSHDVARSVSLYERLAAPTDMKIMEVTTTSMEAYNYFLKGRDDYENYSYDDARKFLERAIEIDSTFASAYLYLAFTYEMLGEDRAHDPMGKAKAFADGATEKERLNIEASYETNREKRFRILKQLAQKYPKEKRAHARLARYYTWSGLLNKAIEEWQKALELDPNYSAALNNLAYRYAEMGDYTKAIEYLKRYIVAAPGDANPFDSMGDLYFRMGQLDDALKQYREALFVKPDFMSSAKIAYIYALREEYAETMKWIDYLIAKAPSLGMRVLSYWQKAYYNYLLGNIDETFSILDAAEDMLEPTEWEWGGVLINGLRGGIAYDQGNFELARNYMFKAGDADVPEEEYNAISYYISLGLFDLKQGNLDSAKARLALIKPLLPAVVTVLRDHALFLHNLFYVHVLLAQDSLEKSIAVFNEISKFEVTLLPDWWFSAECIVRDVDVLARAYYKKGDLESAITEYVRLTDPDPNKRGRTLIRPTWHYELAKLYEEKGLKTKAIEQYEKFLEIWKDADEDRPELIDAKKRVTKLKASI